MGVDVRGSIYLTGWTTSADFPVENAFQTNLQNNSSDGFVTVLGPEGQDLNLSTYFGGNASDGPQSISTNESGTIFFGGWTDSGNSSFPLKDEFDGVQNSEEGFSAAISGDSLVYSSYIGGSGNNEDVLGIEMVPNSSAKHWVVGRTTSADFPTTANAFDPTFGPIREGFMTKISFGGS